MSFTSRGAGTLKSVSVVAKDPAGNIATKQANFTVTLAPQEDRHDIPVRSGELDP